jgi:hypothetical protein
MQQFPRECRCRTKLPKVISAVDAFTLCRHDHPAISTIHAGRGRDDVVVAKPLPPGSHGYLNVAAPLLPIESS